jgi:hypothetical protein
LSVCQAATGARSHRGPESSEHCRCRWSREQWHHLGERRGSSPSVGAHTHWRGREACTEAVPGISKARLNRSMLQAPAKIWSFGCRAAFRMAGMALPMWTVPDHGVVHWWRARQRGQAMAEADVDSDKSIAHFRSSSLSDPYRQTMSARTYSL